MRHASEHIGALAYTRDYLWNHYKMVSEINWSGRTSAKWY